MYNMETIHRRTCVYQIGYHIVFCTKYRKKVLVGKVSDDLLDIFQEIALEKRFTIEQQEANEDHVHLFVSAPPHTSISVLLKWIKGISARRLLAQYPGIRKQLYRGHLWNPSYYVGTVGDMSEAVVRKYIANQKGKAD